LTPIRLHATAADTSAADAANRRLSIDVDPAYILAAAEHCGNKGTKEREREKKIH